MYIEAAALSVNNHVVQATMHQNTSATVRNTVWVENGQMFFNLMIHFKLKADILFVTKESEEYTRTTGAGECP